MPAHLSLLLLSFLGIFTVSVNSYDDAESPENSMTSPPEIDVTCDNIANAWVPEGYSVKCYAKDASWAEIRGITTLPNGDLLVVKSGTSYYSAPGTSELILLQDTNGDGVSSKDERVTLWEQNVNEMDDALSINHGIAYRDGYVYVSGAIVVYRFPYTMGSTEKITAAAEIVVHNIHGGGENGLRGAGGHTVRPLTFDDDGWLYVSVGSKSNVDVNPSRSHIKRFNIANLQSGGFDHVVDGEMIAYGVRNAEAIDVDRHGVLWGAENCADELEVDHLGGDIHNENPAEELNRFPPEDHGRFYGYPYCWTEFLLSTPPGEGRGSQWEWPVDPFYVAGGFNITDYEKQWQDIGVSDAWCKNSTNNKPPEMALHSHSAPLGARFYNYDTFPGMKDAFFIGYHGSWNRNNITGNKVVVVPMTDKGRVASSQPYDFLRSDSSDDHSWGIRPVDLDFDHMGQKMYVTAGSDCWVWTDMSINAKTLWCTTGTVMVVEYTGDDNVDIPFWEMGDSPTKEIDVSPTSAPTTDISGSDIPALSLLVGVLLFICAA